MTTKNGGPAFPLPVSDDRDCCGRFDSGFGGMTLRDYFAAEAVVGLMGRDWTHHTGTDLELIDVWATSAYGIADAMLKAREGKP